MNKNVKVIFDRKNQASKTRKGKIDIRIYLKDGERKFETVGRATIEDSEAAMQSKNIVAKVKHYEQIIQQSDMSRRYHDHDTGGGLCLPGERVR